MKLEFDMSQFQWVLRQYILANKRDLPWLLNNKLYRIFLHYIRRVKRARRSQIERLGVIGYKVSRSRKTGRKTYRKARNAAITSKHSRARAIVVADLRRKGELAGSTGASIEDKARKLIMDRIKAIGSLAAAGIPVVRKLGNVVNRSKRPLVTSRISQFSKDQSSAKPATARDPVAIARVFPDSLDNKNVQEYVEKALALGFAKEQADMERYLMRKFKENARKLNIPVR